MKQENAEDLIGREKALWAGLRNLPVQLLLVLRAVCCARACLLSTLHSLPGFYNHSLTNTENVTVCVFTPPLSARTHTHTFTHTQTPRACLLSFSARARVYVSCRTRQQNPAGDAREHTHRHRHGHTVASLSFYFTGYETREENTVRECGLVDLFRIH